MPALTTIYNEAVAINNEANIPIASNALLYSLTNAAVANIIRYSSSNHTCTHYNLIFTLST